MLTDPGTVVITYGTVTFTSNAYHNTKISAKPVQDEAKRTTVAVEYSVEVQSTITATTDGTGSTDAQLATMRRILEQPAQGLSIKGLGFGDLVCNTLTSPARDLSWGPWPQVVSWSPSGFAAADITWRVIVTIPECNSPTYQKGIAALCWDVTWEVDKDGYTTVSTSGYLEIPLTRGIFAPRVLQDSADRYRDNNTIKWPPTRVGFQRQGGGNFKLSMDRRRLDFAFTDVEVPVPLPDGVTQATITHSIRSSDRDAFRIWYGSISGPLTLARNVPRTEFWAKMKLIIDSRLKGLAQLGFFGRLFARIPGNFIPSGMEITEDVFGRGSSFSYQYRILGQTLAEVMGNSGLWQPIAGTSFGSWKASLDGVGKANGIRGCAGLKHQLNDDVILDLCVPGSGPANVGTTDVATKFPSPKAPPSGGMGAKIEDPEMTWLRYNIAIEVEEIPGRVVHKPIRDKPVQDPPPPPANIGSQNPVLLRSVNALPNPADGLDNPADDMAAPAADEEPADIEDIIQNVAAPSYRIIVRGNALRVGYPIPRPSLEKFGGQPVFYMGGYFSHEERLSFPCGDSVVPIYLAKWTLYYRVKKKPEPGFIPANPWTGFPGVKGSITYKPPKPVDPIGD